jgi:hypothetical protein
VILVATLVTQWLAARGRGGTSAVPNM